MNLAHRWHRFMDWLIPPEPAQPPPWQPPALSPAALAAPTGMHTGSPPRPGPVLTAAASQDTPPPHGRQALTMMPPLQTEWEERAWNAYRHIGAARRAVNWLANNASRCHLYIGKVSDDGVSPPEPVDDPGLAGELLDELRDHLGESALLKRMAQHILVTGATWLAGYPAPPPPDQLATPATPTSGNMEPPIEPEPGPGGDPQTEWVVLSRKEWMDGEGGGIRLKLPDHPHRAPDGWVSFQPDEDVVLIPIYEPDARDAHYATSEFEAALRDTDELDGLSRRVAADIKSRLIGGGVAAVAESATMPNPGANAGSPLNADPFITAVNAAARTAIQNPDSPDATLPIWIKVADEAFAGDGPIKHITFATPFDDAIPVLREEARKAIAADLDIPAEIVLGVSDLNHWCVDENTEILTWNGWRKHYEVAPSDMVLTLNHETGLTEWQPVLAVNRWDVVDEPMVAIEGKYHTSLTTLSHRWPVLQRDKHGWVRSWRTSDRLRREHRITTAAPAACIPTETKYCDAFVELVAWFWTEGQCRNRPDRNVPQVSISQSAAANPDYVSLIRRALTTLYGPPTGGPLSVGKKRSAVPRWREYNWNNTVRFRLNWPAALPLVAVAPNRIVSLEFIHSLTLAQLGLFVDTSIRGDGHTRANGSRVLTQKDPRMLEAFELAVIRQGYTPYRRQLPNGMHALSIASGQKRHYIRPTHRRTVHWSGTIWCPTTPNGTWLARHEGTVFYTGNSAWMVDDSAVKSHLGPLMTTIVNGLTHKITWPVLRAHGETKVEDRCVWWSAAAVIQRPDRSEVTLKANQQGIVGGKAARRELGFSEDDKPEPDEKASRLAVPGQPGEPGGQQRPVGQGGQARPGDTPNPPKPPASTSNGNGRRATVPAG